MYLPVQWCGIAKEEHHIVTDQQFIEYYIVDNFMTDNMQEYVTEISIHIKPTQED